MVANELTKEKVLDAVSELNGGSATSISRHLGFQRKSEVVTRFLNELVDEGSLVCDEDGSFPVYNVSSSRSTYTPSADAPSRIINECNGYRIEESSNDGFVVTMPGASAPIIVPRGGNLIVINNDPEYRWAVDCPEDVNEALQMVIDDYTRDHGIVNFLITDMSNDSTVSSVEEINKDNLIIFLTISKHNKAG